MNCHGCIRRIVGLYLLLKDFGKDEDKGITTYGVENNSYSGDIQAIITFGDLFA